MTTLIHGMTHRQIIDVCNRADARDPRAYHALCNDESLSDAQFLEAVKQLAGVALADAA